MKDPLARECKHVMELKHCVRCLREKVDAAEQLRQAASSYAGDTGLHHDAWLWDKIEAYDNAGLPPTQEGNP